MRLWQEGLALLYASPRLKGTKAVVLAAVKSNERALHNASEALRGDREVIA